MILAILNFYGNLPCWGDKLKIQANKFKTFSEMNFMIFKVAIYSNVANEYLKLNVVSRNIACKDVSHFRKNAHTAYDGTTCLFGSILI